MACQSRFDAIDTVGIFRPRAADVSRCLRTERYVSACSPHVFGMFPASPRHDRLSFHHSHLLRTLFVPFSTRYVFFTAFCTRFRHLYMFVCGNAGTGYSRHAEVLEAGLSAFVFPGVVRWIYRLRQTTLVEMLTSPEDADFVWIPLDILKYRLR